MSSEQLSATHRGGMEFLAGGGDMGRRIRDFDWAATDLGPPQLWPQSLKIAVRIMLTSRQPIWIGWGKELIYLYNDPYKSIIGGKHPEALGQPTSRVWREIWNDIGPMLATALAGDEGTYVEQQLLIMERNGYPEETYYTFSYSPVADDDGSVGGIICANSDDTQRVISERQLTLLHDLAAKTANCRAWQEACEHSAAAMQTDPWDLPFAMIYVGEQGGDDLRLAGSTGIETGHLAAPENLLAHSPWPAARALDKNEFTLVTDLAQRFPGGLPRGPWASAPSQAALIPISAGGESARPEILIVGLNPFRLFDDSYRAFLTLVAGQIISAIANAEAYEEERRRAEALAEIDRAKTAFFSNVSHEFRTPLTLMMSPLEDVLSDAEEGISAKNRGLLQVAHRNSLRLLKLTNTLLDFSRIEAGRVQAQYEPVDLATLTSDLASSFRSAVERAGLALRIECPALAEPVFVDRDMWEKVVLNLLSNAFKFTFDGEISVTCGRSADGTMAEVTIRDTGVGIAPEELPHIFERFRRVEGARGRSIEGSGIGLALVQELVRLHGGKVGVESIARQGSAFKVSLPFGAAHLPARRVDASRRQVSTSVRAQAYVDEALGWLSNHPSADLLSSSASEDIGVSLRIDGAEQHLVLLADDNADMRQYIERLLVSAGFRVELAADGEAALAAAQKLKPDLVLSDVMMPKLDGFGLLAALRADQELQDIPVLLLSARAGEEAKVEGIRSLADDYLTKPFSAQELLARVESNLHLSAMRKESKRLLREEAQTLDKLFQIGTVISAEIELERAVKVVTDAATELCGAAFGAFFYNVVNADGEAYTLYTLSGVPREAFASFPMPRNTDVFGPTFRGEGIIRSADITQDPRYGRNTPHHGMPKGHLPVRSYLAAPVISQSGGVIGGLFLGHPDPDVFDQRSEQLIAGVATGAAIAIDKANLYRAAQDEIERRRQVEEKLRESEQLLERKVADRTAELRTANEHLVAEAQERERAEEALRQAQKMESIGHLTGGVAHDFNNLLTVIIGNLETLQRHLREPKPGGGALERAADLAMRGAQRAASLTHRLLAFSRQQPLEPKPLNVNQLVGGMSDLLRRTIGEQVAIETVLGGGLWTVYADPNQLEVAILNLAINARDAMPKGGKLTIETANAYLDETYAALQAEVVAGQYVVIAVTDSGIGMSRETLARAFEPFYTTKDVGHGTGLGLSQVYGFVKQSGGHIKLYSEVGEGTTAKIYLPRSLRADRAVEPELTAKAPGAGHAEVVLVVEDDPDVRAHSVGILEELGYRVIEAPNGETALRLLRQNPQIELLFTDVGLPGGMNGRQLADAARQIKTSLKVLFTTGYARNAIVHDGRLDAGVQLITKPFTYAALAAKLRDVIDAPVKTGRILVVEDDALIQMLEVDNLSELGFKAETVGSALEALNAIRLTPHGYDGAMIDIGLPDRSGDVLVPELRALSPHLPIVIVSGHSRTEMASRITDRSRLAFLSKPFAVHHLRAALAEAGIEMPEKDGD